MHVELREPFKVQFKGGELHGRLLALFYLRAAGRPFDLF